ncbi:MAG TPA: hypothetical protein VFY45_02560 [Baekduia sp.]|nr:hypothetical protein [Baekduia sp.]
MSKSIHVVVGALLCAVLGLALAGPAQAATSYAPTGAFAQTANDGGVTPIHNGRIAVNHVTGDVYVTDTVNDRIDVYRPNSTGADPLTTFGAGSLTDPFGIAIDDSTGEVYVSDSANSRIRKFTGDGAPTPTFTLDGTFTSPGNASALAFDQAAGQLVYIDPTSQQVKRATTSGVTTGAPFNGDTSGTAFTALQDLAVTSAGEIVVVDSTGDPAQATGESRIERYAANGDHDGTLGPVSGAATVAVIPDGDQILVSGLQDAVNSSAYATLTIFANDGTQTVAFNSAEQFSIVTGIAAVTGSGARLYVASDASPLWGAAYGAASVQAFEPFTLPTVTAPAVSAITGTSAHLSATINPLGGTTSYRFEISPDGSSWTAIDPDDDGDEDAGSGSSDTTIGADVTGLTPNSGYQVRTVVTKNGIPVTSGETPLTTLLVAPPATTGPATAITGESATLRGTITTYGTAATYRFEYGTTTSYGTSIPATNAAIEAGQGDVNVEQKLTGLAAGTTYHYRLVAINAAGTANGEDQSLETVAPAAADTCPNAAIRARQGSDRLPGCRAYEQVSPRDKNGYSVHFAGPVGGGFPTFASIDGEAASYPSYGPFGDVPTGMLMTYRSQRTGSGWQTEAVSPFPVDPDPDVVSNVGDTKSLWDFVSQDLQRGGIVTRDHFDPTDVNDAFDVYLRHGLEAPTLASRGNGPERVGPDGVQSLSYNFSTMTQLSDDGTHALFATDSHLVPEDADRAASSDLYERFDGRTYLVNQANGGGLLSRCGSELSHQSSGGNISHDGSRIIFQTPRGNSSGHPDCDLPTQVYMRVNHAETIHVSASQRTPADPTQSAVFVGASADGNVVLVSSGERLTDDASSGGGIYTYRVSTGELKFILDWRVAPGNVIQISADGSHVYYISNFVEAPGGVFGADNVYVYDVSDGQKHFVAADPANVLAGNLGYKVVSPDGEHFLFRASEPLTTFDSAGKYEIYLYDEPQERLTCISCDPAGQRPVGSTVATDAAIRGGNAPSLTADGKTAVFQSGDQLVPEDINGKQDIYAYSDGRLRLITPGDGKNQSNLIGVSSDGRDIIFATVDGLVAGDRDGDIDVYDARAGGGFPESDSDAPKAPCAGDACQGATAPTSSVSKLGSVSFVGPGNGPAGPGASKPRVSKVPTVRGTSVTLRVTVPAKGRLRASGAGLVQARRTVSKAGAYRVTVRLSAAARRTLRRRHTTRIWVTVRFTPAGGAPQDARVRVTFTLTTKGGR